MNCLCCTNVVYSHSVDVKKTFSHTICGVCSKPYNDPRILPCLHSFCQQCLQYEIEKYGSQQVFTCPTCEKSTSIPVGGASVIPQNLHLGFEVEVAGYVSKLVSNSEVCCDQCIDGSSGPAVVFCCTCRQFMCTFCHEYHKRNRQLSKHTIVGLDQDGANQLQTILKPSDHYHSRVNHEDNKLNLYCETCNCIIHTSRDCIHVDHKHHTITELSAVAKVHRSAIEEVLTHARGIMIKLTEAINGNDKIIEQVEISKRNALLAINQAFELLQQTSEERKKTLLSEVEAISLSKTTALTSQKEQFEKMVEDIGHYTEVASHILQTHTDHEVVSMGGLVPTELKATLKQVEAVSLTPNKHSNIHVSVAQTDGLVRGLSKFGHVSELSPALRTWTWTSTSVPRAKAKYHVKVESKTSKGEGYPHGGAQVKGEMRSKAHNGAVVCGEVEDHGDGTYTITLTPQTAGPHQLAITMDGQHVKNSPHDLDVRPKRDYLTLRDAQQVIKCNSSPYCVAIHDSGDIYVGTYADCIYVFDQRGQLKKTIGNRGSGDGHFNGLHGIFIKADVLYVADYFNKRVQMLTTGGKFINNFAIGSSPTGVIIDKYDRIIVSDSSKKIHIYSHNGADILTIDGQGTTNRCCNLYGLALDPQGNIHVAVSTANIIKVFTTGGVYVRFYGDPNGPSGIAFDDEGNSIVSEDDCLSIRDPERNKIHTVGNLNSPRCVALDPRDGSVYVADYKAQIVLKYCL